MANGKKSKKKKTKKKKRARRDVPLGTKLQYVGVGMVLGVAAAPTVRKWMERARPELDALFERLTAQAEELAEEAGDWMAAARKRVEAAANDAPAPVAPGDPHEGHAHARRGEPAR